MDQPLVVLDGTALSCEAVTAVARGQARVGLSQEGRDRALAAARVAALVSERSPVYGRTTGVGSNRDVSVGLGDIAGHGLRLARSHAGGGGQLIDAELGRAMLVVRANQIAAGGSGVDPGVLDVLADCVNRGLSVPVRRYGAIGTGDLTALAMTVLCLLGERDWLPAAAGPGQDESAGPTDADPGAAKPGAVGPDGAGPGGEGGPGGQPRFRLAPADAVGFISSNAATLGEAALACHDLALMLRAALVPAAFAHLAVDASMEPYAAAVQDARPHHGQQVVAAAMRALLAGHIGPAARIQDPFGYRAFPQVHGPAVDAARRAERTVTVELNAAAENPLIDVAGQAAWHNGNFHTTYVGLALDAVRAALFQTAALSAARLGTLVEPAFTGLAPFLATDRAPSSGIMILEYVSHSAAADIRRLAAPAALGSAVLSRGVEEHAGFSTQSARATTDVITAYQVVLACELIAAVRALRLRGIRPAGAALGEAFALTAGALPAGTADRPLDDDLAAAQQLLPRLASLPPD
ncbi:MAG TPA: aromatic amino acid ammonia-lyase [Streptosporangiaceae bacterium]|jgi:histidine ammonia-lyase